MCPPAAAAGASAIAMYWTSMAVTVASTAAGLYAQQEQANSEKKYQEAQQEEYARTAKLNQEAANKEYIEAASQERINQMQQTQVAAQQTQEIQLERMEKQGEAIASSNAAGQALDSLYTDYYRQEANKRDVIQQQLEMVGVNADTNIQAYQDRSLNRQRSQQSYIGRPISSPNYLGAALSIGDGYLNASTKYNERTAKQQ